MTDKDTLLASDRTEDLSGEQVLRLFAGAEDESLVTALQSPGTHLLLGSRGTGKTMLRRVAFERLRDRQDVLPVFVRFSKYLATYNAGTQRTAGYSPFQSWILAKLLQGVRDSLSEKGRDVPPVVPAVPLDNYISLLETHYQDPGVADPARNAAELGVAESELLDFGRLDRIQERVLSLLDRCNMGSVAFFLDEAAQSFAEELQPEFFELIKHLRHHRIWVKAAVYPHTTNYGPDFDVGQDAISLPIERAIETKEGMEFFSDFIAKRYEGTDLGTALARSETPRNFLIKMSGGNPRWFIHLMNRVTVTKDNTVRANDAVAAAKELPVTTLWPYLYNLKSRLQSKRRYFDSAIQLGQVLIDGLREVNARIPRGSSERPFVFVAVSKHKTVPFRVHASLRLLQYAGILSDRGFKKSSPRESAEMYLLHPAIQLRDNTLLPSDPNPAIESVVAAFTDPLRDRFKEYTRNSPRLLEYAKDDEEGGVICVHCEKALPSDARFCSNCGKPVIEESPYTELLDAPATELQLTPGVKALVLSDGRFQTVGSILRASDSELDSIRGVGSERIKLIRYAAEELVAG